MPVQMIRCRGRCKQRKIPVLFRPSDLRSKRPICRDCRKNVYSPTPARGHKLPGAAWRRSARRLFRKAIEEGRAA